MDIILQRLDEIHTELEFPPEHFRGELLAERDTLFDLLGEFYLTAAPRQRGAIRRFVSARRRLMMALEDRVTWHAFRIKTAEDVEHLRLGLAVASIVDGGMDRRDFGLNVSGLFNAASRVGIDPRPYFREGANFSSKGRSFLHGWT